ncbi:MAG: transglycosylase SLT domain-containing protein [Ketobacter sp.]
MDHTGTGIQLTFYQLKRSSAEAAGNNEHWLTGLLVLCLTLCSATNALGQSAEKNEWQKVVRDSPYWVSKGAFYNLKTIRRWVLNSESFCGNKERHILFDKSATFLGYVNDAGSSEATQIKLNRERKNLAESGKANVWVMGAPDVAGYPFALSCNQPDAQLAVSLDRYFGRDKSARLWGTWDGMRIGDTNNKVSLHEAISIVYKKRLNQGRISLPPSILATLAGKTLIESGGQKTAHSAADARGIMQLSRAALKDCGLSEKFHFHRMAQIDCALKLMEQNHRNLKPVFDQVFKHLPKNKSDQLYSLLLIQAYHGGVGRVSQIISDPAVQKAAQYFAKNQRHFSAGDIALGLVFHNLGREQLGFASLYYLADVAVATELACKTKPTIPGCK